VRRQVQRVGGELVTSGVKTARSRKAVNLAPAGREGIESAYENAGGAAGVVRSRLGQRGYAFTRQFGKHRWATTPRQELAACWAMVSQGRRGGRPDPARR
jgi:hypothetical protein